MRASATFDESAFTGLEGVRLIPSDDPQDTTFHLKLGRAADRSSDVPEVRSELNVVLWENGAAKITAQGSIDIQIKPDIGGNYGWSRGLEDFHFMVSEKSQLDIKFMGEGTVNLQTAGKEIKVKVATIPIGSQFVLVGVFPVWVTPEISIYLGVDAEFKASLTAGVTAQSSRRIGIAYKRGVKGLKTIYEPPADSWSFIKPALSAEGMIKGYVEAGVEFLLYGPRKN